MPPPATVYIRGALQDLLSAHNLDSPTSVYNRRDLNRNRRKPTWVPSGYFNIPAVNSTSQRLTPHPSGYFNDPAVNSISQRLTHIPAVMSKGSQRFK